MDGKFYGAVHDEINSHRVQTVNGKSQFIGDTIDDVTQQVVSVDGLDMDRNRVEDVFFLVIVHRNYAVSIL